MKKLFVLPLLLFLSVSVSAQSSISFEHKFILPEFDLISISETIPFSLPELDITLQTEKIMERTIMKKVEGLDLV